MLAFGRTLIYVVEIEIGCYIGSPTYTTPGLLWWFCFGVN